MKNQTLNHNVLDQDDIEFNLLKTLALKENKDLNNDFKWMQKKLKLKTSQNNFNNNFQTPVSIKLNDLLVLDQAQLIKNNINKVKINWQKQELFWFDKRDFCMDEFNNILKTYLNNDLNSKKKQDQEQLQNVIVVNKFKL
ncbi:MULTISPECIES: hypothetical protein [unclassified Mycoplasma]|uniref:hypothetical protein n=1 Tax=unclassified Mycoplasma TaxID=2683645 RepID=UPI00211CA662|nr:MULTISPECIES: hypothetical protein [unclassified Mycoplasma]UUM19523.1 hypothetical protein NPA11_01940 [Mycoplasma sp. 1578d]UUM24443.1 hypothetical protein NPA12_01915 [Mycoplasma sp. 3686d]